MKKQYVSYYRVSTTQQEKSGLGLDGQKSMVDNFISSNNGTLIKSFIEIETGTSKKQRKIIYDAIAYAKEHKAILCIAKLDRISRNVHFISSLLETGIEFVAVDIPQANNFTIHLYAALAEQEAKMISDRTTRALAEKKKQGFQLGNPDNFKNEHRMLGGAATKLKSQSNKANIQATAMIVQYREKGFSYEKIAKLLLESNFLTMNGNKFSPTGVMRLYKRHKPNTQNLFNS